MPSTVYQRPPADEGRPAPGRPSRAEIARVAADAASSVGGVGALAAGGPLTRLRTAEGAIDGVAVFPDTSGTRYSVDLWIHAALVDLVALGEDVRLAVTHAARQAGIGDAIGEVCVHVTDVDDGRGAA